MDSNQLREKFLKFFEKRGHKRVSSSSLVPDDPSVLFTTAGMQQFKPYFIGKKDAEKDFGTLNTTSFQKCIRTSDIEEVGDESHLTFLEMLGNFSFGGYFKREAIEYAYEFMTKELGLKISYVSIFGGDEEVPEDKESFEIWRSIGIPEDKIKKFGREDNFWGPTGDEGPCGPTVEIYINDVEIWNIVFNEYYCRKDGKLEPLETKGVDTGMGLERLAAVVQGKKSVYETDLFEALVRKIQDTEYRIQDTRAERIVADHIKASVFLIADGVMPSNIERGYVLRRLIRRAIRYADMLKIKEGKLLDLVDIVAEIYKDPYPNIFENIGVIKEEIQKEEEKFRKTLRRGMKQFEKLAQSASRRICGKDAFILFSTYGFPLEMTLELAKEKGIKVDTKGFEEEMRRHQEISRADVERKFKGGLAGYSEMEIKYHTATHLLHQALREVLGDHVVQKGSNITPERLRFDFSHPEKMTDEEKQKVEDLVNEKIKESLPVTFQEMSVEEAKKRGALGVFEEKYGEKVKVYQIGKDDNVFSVEICGGPHVENTAELGHFKIKKEESVAAGVRRIKAILT